MTLTPEQAAAVTAWIAAGENLSTVQRRLAEEFKVAMTYRDVRFLVDDLGLALRDAAPKIDTSDVTKSPPPARAGDRTAAGEKKGMLDKLKEKVGLGAGAPDDEDELPADEFPEAAAPAPGHGVKIDVDRVVRPGAVVSGNVTFSDGVGGKWAIDQYGRLMLDTGKPGYKPGPADVSAFQRELQLQLQRHGF